MSESSEKNMLRFGCPSCETRLVVDPSLAGKEGPCPSCGEIIIAPPIAAATSLVAKAAPPVVVKPRDVSRKHDEPVPPSAPASDQRQRMRGRGVQVPAVAASPVRSPGSRQVASKTPVSQTSVSQPQVQSNDVKTLLIILLITLLVVCVALGIYYYMTMEG